MAKIGTRLKDRVTFEQGRVLQIVPIEVLSVTLSLIS